ncbi:MAG: FAD-dependent oxidoreductase [Gemmatimonadota bacterium]
MLRRDALRVLAMAPVLARARPSGLRPPKRVVVIGAGILGSATAYRLATLGAEVTLCERATPGSGASEKSFAWINAYASKQPRGYYELNRSSQLVWRELQDRVPELPLKWGGRIEWQPSPDAVAELSGAVRRQQSWGYPIEMLDRAALRARAPALRLPDTVESGVFASDEGGLDAGRACQVLARAAETAGARLLLSCEVVGFDVRGGLVRAVRSSAGELPADAVVVAAGVDTPRIAAWMDVRVPLRDAPGVLAQCSATGPEIGPIVVGPDVIVKQHADGRMVIGGGFTGEPVYRRDRPESERMEAERVLTLAQARFDAMDGVTLERTTVGWRPLPTDGHPVVGFPSAAPNLYLMVTHSGVTLSALLSQLAAREILEGLEVDLLAPYRVERFI